LCEIYQITEIGIFGSYARVEETEASDTALPAAMRYILKAESYDMKGARGKLYRIIAGSAV
jgi:predicted nucleotidyltransferase